MGRHISDQVSDRAVYDAGGEAQEKAAPDMSNDMPNSVEKPLANILLADLMIRAGSYVVRDSVEKGILRGRYGRQNAKQILNNKSLKHKAVTVGLATLATRNIPGAVIVGGGALMKALYDRSKTRRKARRRNQRRRAEGTQLHDRT